MGNKERELAQLKRFSELYPEFPSGRVLPTEKPDFIIEGANGIIGIELSELYWKSAPRSLPYQSMESIRQRIVNLVSNELKCLGVPNIAVTICFNSFYKFDKMSASPIAKKIVVLLQQVMPATEGRAELGVNEGWERLPEAVDELSVWRSNELREIHVNAPGASFIPKVEVNFVQQKIAKKESKLPVYRKNAASIWLILTADHGFISSLFDTQKGLPEVAYETGFDRIFLFEYVAGRVHELDLVR